jgi:hypothetical protein
MRLHLRQSADHKQALFWNRITLPGENRLDPGHRFLNGDTPPRLSGEDFGNKKRLREEVS